MIEYTTWFIIAYFVALNGSYLALNFLSIFALSPVSVYAADVR